MLEFWWGRGAVEFGEVQMEFRNGSLGEIIEDVARGPGMSSLTTWRIRACQCDSDRQLC